MIDVIAVKVGAIVERLLQNKTVLVVSDENNSTLFFESLQCLTDCIYCFYGDSFLRDVLRWYETEEKEGAVIVTTQDVLRRGLPTRAALKKESLTIRRNQHGVRQPLVDFLIAQGYFRVPVVESPGEFAVRGLVVDVFPRGEMQPVRVQFSGGRVDRLGFFDPVTQRTENEIFCYSFVAEHAPRFRYVPFLSVMPSDFELLVDECISLLHDGAGSLVPESINYRVLSPLSEVCSNSAAGEARLEEFISYLKRSSRRFFSSMKSFINERLEKGWTVVFACPNPFHLERFYEEFLNVGLSPVIWKANLSQLVQGRKTKKAGKLYMVVAPGAPCLDLESVQFSIITASRIFGTRGAEKKRTAPQAHSLRDIVRGDFVVHRDYGIGRFEGIVQETVRGVTKEFLKIVYAGGDRLFCPVENMHLVHKYLSPSGKEPHLDKLGGRAWQIRKRKVRMAVEKVAHELLEIYAKKETARPIKFSRPGELYEEFEKTFPYEETESQHKAIEEVINDLTSEYITDRLICGDVGFGKTEVALRAAFKAVEDGFQVLLLAPTTLLVHQHYRIFSERLK